LDRFSVGAGMAYQLYANKNESYRPALMALTDSLALQPRNANGGLWYYNNVDNLNAYRNLSYLDGMYSYSPFVVYEAVSLKITGTSPAAALKDALLQLRLLYDICRHNDTGLLVHGYDAIKAHKWADPVTGASPVVWSRSLAWYSLGLLFTLQAAAPSTELNGTTDLREIEKLFASVMHAQLDAAEHSLNVTSRPGVWQVVDKPGAKGNFVEASSSFLTVFTLLRGERLGYLPGAEEQVRQIACNMYVDVRKEYLMEDSDGTLSLNGTGAIASLSGQQVDYEYYVNRPIEKNMVIGTSAFVAASYEAGYAGCVGLFKEEDHAYE
jgi:rhamnogalacturonyl hydrolase YesR